MKKSLFFVAAAALALTACTSENEATQDVTQKAAPKAVAFDTYLTNTTRAYTTGVMTTELLGDPGFGVFAYHNEASTSANGTYANTVGPNYMYNQKVTYGTAWTYTPLKYWPNETTMDMHAVSGAATSRDKNDVISFFAYAPWVASSTNTTAGTNAGINAIMANDVDDADPWIQYTVSLVPSQSVDLVWGVAPAGGLSYTAVNNNNISVGQGLPLKDLVKPSKDQKIKFLFQHALARIGFTVVAAVDQIAPGGNLDGATNIFVNSVTITDADNDAPYTIPTYGKLNLNNPNAGVAYWTDQNYATRFSATISGANLNEDLTTGHAGVTTTEKKVIAQSGSPLKDQYLMLIPTPGAVGTFNVTIDYDVVTTDAELSAGKSTVNNVITKQISLNTPSTFSPGVGGFMNNKAYNLKLILGLTSVKLDADVADWEVNSSTNVDLPRNEE